VLQIKLHRLNFWSSGSLLNWKSPAVEETALCINIVGD
jgi:hypothetical protein